MDLIPRPADVSVLRTIARITAVVSFISTPSCLRNASQPFQDAAWFRMAVAKPWFHKRCREDPRLRCSLSLHHSRFWCNSHVNNFACPGAHAFQKILYPVASVVATCRRYAEHLLIFFLLKTCKSKAPAGSGQMICSSFCFCIYKSYIHIFQ